MFVPAQPRQIQIYNLTARVPTFLFLPRSDVICDLLLNKPMAKWIYLIKGATITKGFSFFAPLK